MNIFMQKRGQVSIFAIIGVVLVILVALFFFLRNEFGFFVSTNTFLDEKSKPIEDNLRKCVRDVTNSSLDSFSKQGGDFNPTSYLYYQSRNVKYYCTNIPNEKACLNVMPTFSDLLNNLNKQIQNGINNCIDKDLVKDGLGYELQVGKLTTKLDASGNNVVVTSKYDVKIKKGEFQNTIKPVVVNFDAPIEELYGVAVDVVNSEATEGYFEQLFYMLNKRGQYLIQLDKPYPDKIYKLQKRGSNFEFWFAIQGERDIYA